MVGAYVYKELPPYTVEVSFAADPFRENQDWFLIKVAYALRDELVPIIAVSAFAFLVFFVYLCCAAGRRPGSAEVRAGGLNRLPLDAYGFGTVFGTVGLVWLGFMGMDYFYDGSPMVALAFMAALSYAAAVLAAIGGDCSGDEFDQMERLAEVSNVPIPKNLAGLREKEERHTDVIDKETMLDYIMK